MYDVIGVYVNAEQRDKQMLRNRGLWTEDETWIFDQDDIGVPEIEEGDGFSPTYNTLCYVRRQTSSITFEHGLRRAMRLFARNSARTVHQARGLKLNQQFNEHSRGGIKQPPRFLCLFVAGFESKNRSVMTA